MVESRRERSCLLKVCGIGKERLEKGGKFVSSPSCLWEWKARDPEKIKGDKFPDGRVGPFHIIGRHGLRAYIAEK